MFKIAERSDGCSGETLLAPCTRKKKLQRKMTNDYYWIGVQENIGMFSKGGFPVMAETTRNHIFSKEISQVIIAAMVLAPNFY